MFNNYFVLLQRRSLKCPPRIIQTRHAIKLEDVKSFLRLSLLCMVEVQRNFNKKSSSGEHEESMVPMQVTLQIDKQKKKNVIYVGVKTTLSTHALLLENDNRLQ